MIGPELISSVEQEPTFHPKDVQSATKLRFKAGPTFPSQGCTIGPELRSISEQHPTFHLKDVQLAAKLRFKAGPKFPSRGCTISPELISNRPQAQLDTA